jgi:hypothetical protein
MPHIKYHRVLFELAHCICALFSRDGVPLAHVTKIIGALMLIQRLRAYAQSRSSPQLDDVPSNSHHGPSSSHALGERLTPPSSASHASIYVVWFSDSPLLLSLPYLSSPFISLDASSIGILPPPPSPLHV